MNVLKSIDWVEAAKHAAFAVIAGVVCGLGSVLLCIIVGWAFDVFRAFPYLIWGLPIMGVAQVILYEKLSIPTNLTTHKVVERIRSDVETPPQLAPGILIGTATTILSGGSVGKEAGALQMGASLGTLSAKPFKIRHILKSHSDDSLNGYIAGLGMAAEFSALFFSPLGSAVFVLELSRYKKSLNVHIIFILLACFIAYFVASFIGIGDYIDPIQPPAYDWNVFAQCVIIAVAVAFLGSVFDAAIKLIHAVTWSISKNAFIWVISGGLLYAILVTVFGWNEFTGSGESTLNDALKGNFDQMGFAIKALLTLICLGFWFKGGEITPSFCIGGLLGATCAMLTGGDVVFGVALGVIAFFAAFSRCPLAAFLMGCEILGWGMAPFLAVAVFVAFNFSSPVGMYGDGVDHAIRSKLHDKIEGK